jgi:hypothetical protein
MFEGLKKIWQECKDAVDAKWDAEHTIKMTPVFENEHETTPVNLSHSQEIHTSHGNILKMDNQNDEYRITTKCCICGTPLGGLVFDKNNSYSPYDEALASLQVKLACSKQACVLECEQKYYPENFRKLIGECKGHGEFWKIEDEIWRRLSGARTIRDIPFNPKFKKDNSEGCPQPSFRGNDSGTSIDTEIAALVAEMNRVGIRTACSCQTDGGEAYVCIRLGEGTTYEHRKDIFGPGQDELVLRWKLKSKPAPACASDINTGFI